MLIFDSIFPALSKGYWDGFEAVIGGTGAAVGTGVLSVVGAAVDICGALVAAGIVTLSVIEAWAVISVISAVVVSSQDVVLSKEASKSDIELEAAVLETPSVITGSFE